MRTPADFNPAAITQEEREAMIAKIVASHEANRKRQIERLDMDVSDCALSTWATDLTMRLEEAQLKILRAGGKAKFRILVRLDGSDPGARLVSTKYGMRWVVGDKFLPIAPKRSMTHEQHGYKEIVVDAPAWARVEGQGTGLSGRAWTWVYRADGKPGIFVEQD